ncbi:hypothetical protein RF11_09599 [Thelohanellus kitauei]|uniref:Uncharacterized protein n=1 Tax=Thelohanellus kitauei TaxID=669202 RepID=A0A0C2MKZ6_THEKT|nr:hypothetical protein RF11_09599 [Thelohanellus kitauei]
MTDMFDDSEDTFDDITICYKIINTDLSYVFAFRNLAFRVFVPPYIMMNVIVDYGSNENGSIYMTETFIYHLKYVKDVKDEICRPFIIEGGESDSTLRVSP